MKILKMMLKLDMIHQNYEVDRPSPKGMNRKVIA